MARVWRLSEELEAAGLARPRTYARAAPRVGAADSAPTDTAGERRSWFADHPREAAIGAGLLAAAGVIRMAGASPLLALLALPAGLVAVLVWRRRGRAQHRPRLVVVGGCRWPLPWRWDAYLDQRHIEGEAGRLLSTWAAVAEAAGIRGARLREVVHDPEEGYAVRVEAHGKLATDVKLPRFHSAAGITAEWTIETPDLLRPWEFIVREAVKAIADPHLDAEDPEEPAWSPPPAVDLEAQRVSALRLAVDRLGPEVVSAAELGRRAGGINRDWMAKHIKELAPQLGLRRAKGGWVRLAMAAGEER